MQKPPGKIVAQVHYASRLAPHLGEARLSERNFTPIGVIGLEKYDESGQTQVKNNFHIEKIDSP
jgi:hypothetical protein